jgi:hypothetical protein
MSAQLEEARSGTTERTRERNRLVGGLVLIGVGLVLLIGQFFTLGAFPLILIGLLFTAAGALSHESGWFIPGGVLNGIGLGVTLTENVALGDPAEGGLLLICFALGWASIALFSFIFKGKTHWWPLIPATVMAAIGAPLLLGAAGEAALETVMAWLWLIWPLALVGVGLTLLLRRRG